MSVYLMMLTSSNLARLLFITCHYSIYIVFPAAIKVPTVDTAFQHMSVLQAFINVYVFESKCSLSRSVAVLCWVRLALGQGAGSERPWHQGGVGGWWWLSKQFYNKDYEMPVLVWTYSLQSTMTAVIVNDWTVCVVTPNASLSGTRTHQKPGHVWKICYVQKMT